MNITNMNAKNWGEKKKSGEKFCWSAKKSYLCTRN